MRRAVAAFAFALSSLLVALPANADPNDTIVAAGKHYFEEGVRFYDARPPDYEHALEQFRAAYDVLHKFVIKRNIALALKGLKRHAEAIAAFEEYLVEGREQIEAPVQEAAEKAISEMRPLVGTVRVSVVPRPPPGRAAPQRWTITIDDVEVSEEKSRAAIRLDPREYVFRAHADGYADASKQVTVAPGQYDAPVELELVPLLTAARGSLRVRTAVPTAEIRVDNGAPRRGEWAGGLAVGAHRLMIVAPGYARYDAIVNIRANQLYDLPVPLRAAVTPIPQATVSPDYRPVPAPPLKPRVSFGMAGVSLQQQTLRLGPLLDEPAEGTRRSFTGASLTLKFGRQLGRYFSVAGLGELGAYKVESYESPNAAVAPARIDLVNWVLAPEIRFNTAGDLRFVTGVAFGLEGHNVDATLAQPGGATAQHKGSGMSGVFLFDLGGELHFKRVFVQGVVFFDSHGIGSVTESGSGSRFFLDSPAGRAGLRLLLGYAF